ncbi:palmitoyltransferase ZDHHC16B [Nematolebias whitei]|uniref:palmitoyltransferase ZDHHC16B n=1 Tax=Nematolebias whitei TaxID=451745 RepID=UPI00189800A6|nr:palmitoyltransferase ZDHHC16B [Nematolebias whitei]
MEDLVVNMLRYEELLFYTACLSNCWSLCLCVCVCLEGRVFRRGGGRIVRMGSSWRHLSRSMRLVLRWCWQQRGGRGGRSRAQISGSLLELWSYSKLLLQSLCYNSLADSDTLLDCVFEPVIWTVDSITRWFGVAFVSLVILLTSSVVIIVHLFVIPKIISTYPVHWTVWHLGCGHWLLLMVTFHYYKATVTSPGHPPKNKLKVPSVSICKKCVTPKPPRTHHCSICNILSERIGCFFQDRRRQQQPPAALSLLKSVVSPEDEVSQRFTWSVTPPPSRRSCKKLFVGGPSSTRDHFQDAPQLHNASPLCYASPAHQTSPASGSSAFPRDRQQVASQDNKPQSSGGDDSNDGLRDVCEDDTNLYSTLGCLFCSIQNQNQFIIAMSMNESYNQTPPPDHSFRESTAHKCIIFLWVLTSSVAVALGGLTVWHARLINRGETSVERHINRKETKRLRETGKVFRNPHHHGKIKNWEIFFGVETKSHWFTRVLLPSSHPPDGDGLMWDCTFRRRYLIAV